MLRCRNRGVERRLAPLLGVLQDAVEQSPSIFGRLSGLCRRRTAVVPVCRRACGVEWTGPLRATPRWRWAPRLGVVTRISRRSGRFDTELARLGRDESAAPHRLEDLKCRIEATRASKASSRVPREKQRRRAEDPRSSRAAATPISVGQRAKAVRRSTSCTRPGRAEFNRRKPRSSQPSLTTNCF